MLAAFVLTLPIEDYLPTFQQMAYDCLWFGCLDSNGNNCSAQNYNYEDVVYPIASSFYVGLGFHSLVDARIAGDKVLWPLY